MSFFAPFLYSVALKQSDVQPLPDSVRKDLAEKGGVILPQGTWTISSPLGPGLDGTIAGYGCTLVPAAGYRGAAIEASYPGAQILGVKIVGFQSGIWMRGLSSDNARSAFIKDCQIEDYSGGFGIKWDSPTDGRIVDTSCSQSRFDPAFAWIGGQIGVDADTAQAGIYLGTDAGGTLVSSAKLTGNQRYDILDAAPDSMITSVSSGGGRIAHISLRAWRIIVTGGELVDNSPHQWNDAGLEIGDPAGTDSRYCVVDGLQMGVHSSTPMGSLVRVIHSSMNYFRLVRKRGDHQKVVMSGEKDTDSRFVWIFDSAASK